MSGLHEELDRLSIEELVRFVVPEEEMTAALAVVARFAKDRLATGVLRHYYSFLPEGREEMAVDLRLVARAESLALIALATTGHCYLYLCSAGEAVLLGEFDRGIDDPEVLESFGFCSNTDFRSKVPAFANLEELVGEESGHAAADTCVACGVFPGELHVYGCPVELCPWCEGQLSRCNCRFDQMGIDQLDSEDQLDRFAELLENKGRIPFGVEQNPSYPATGKTEHPAADDEIQRPEGEPED